ncbi:MAG: VOC family protein [Pseudomonadales bacterium]|jgi:catechol 2,3-dioxygenase-like lactoylglutathione lyase family enzyme|nr:VOC family protein [Pseudomonadales bacterium]
MILKHFIRAAAICGLFLTATAQTSTLAPPNPEGVSIGHVHLLVPDVAKSRDIWKSFGATEASSGSLQMLSLPGVYILFREGEPNAPSGDTSINHIAFSVPDYADAKAKLTAVGAKIVLDNEANGQVLADLPDGVRFEFVIIKDQKEPILFHHIHLATVDQPALRDWYVKTFGGEIGERNGMPSAVIPGGRVDMIAARGGPAKPSSGAAIDHIGFEVTDMNVFAAKMQELGIKFDRDPQRRDEINLTIAFITDPVGTSIELTQGLAEVK